MPVKGKVPVIGSRKQGVDEDRRYLATVMDLFGIDIMKSDSCKISHG